MSTAQLLSLATVPPLLAAAMMDVVSRQVPNWIAGWALLCGVIARGLCGDLLASALLAIAVFVALFALWQRGWLGGADVKLLSACTLLIPAGAALDYLLAVAIAGGILALVYLAGRHLPSSTARPPVRKAARSARNSLSRLYRVELWRMHRAAPLPYACAIVAGCCFTMIAG